MLSQNFTQVKSSLRVTFTLKFILYLSKVLIYCPEFWTETWLSRNISQSFLLSKHSYALTTNSTHVSKKSKNVPNCNFFVVASICNSRCGHEAALHSLSIERKHSDNAKIAHNTSKNSKFLKNVQKFRIRPLTGTQEWKG